MANVASPPGREPTFLDARVLQARLISEHVTSAPARPSRSTEQVQVRTDVTSGFNVALDHPAKPTELSVEIDFKVAIRIPDSDKVLAEYESRHVAQFALRAWHGIADWSDVPLGLFSPCFAVIQDLAIRRAESTFLDMGMHGVALPRNDTFVTPTPTAIADHGEPTSQNHAKETAN